MAVAFNKFNAFTQNIANKKIDLSADTFKVMLTNTLPVATNSLYGDISAGEVANGNGYTTGGLSVTITSSVQTSGVLKWLVNQPVLTASGSVGPFRYAALYDFTSSSPLKPLVSWYDYGSAVTLASGDTFTISFDASAGVLTIT